MIRTKSALDPKRPDDGYRILIEPEWPRGLPKGKAGGADWMKSLYPSRNLQGWMQRNPRKPEGFRERYLLELAHNESAVAKVRKLHREYGDVTILRVPVEGLWDIHETLAQYLRAACD
ncbi:MAG: DUF488 family protein [Coriobacteriia bacterium]|nr:DUF488 family protein [Coriobacteriia bacterium]